MKTIQQVSVFLENRSGQLAEITKVLSKENINLRALNIAETADYGLLRLIPDDPRRAANILMENSFLVTLNPVVAISVKDQPGGLCAVLSVIADAGISVDYMYSIFNSDNDKAYMIFRVSDPSRLEAIAEAEGIELAEKSTLGIV